MLIAIVLIVGCREPDSKKSDPTPKTAVISCEAAHVTIEMIRDGSEKSDGNE